MILEVIGGIATILTSGAGGGILGGIFGLFRQKQEGAERVQMRELDLRQNELDAQERREERAHELEMMEKGAHLQLQQTEAEVEAEIEIANQKALSAGQRAEFGNLDTSSGMDNYRASVRPTLAYWAAILFSAFLGWAFWEFGDQITPEAGLQILMGMFATLTFVVTSVVTFYYVTRRNTAPKL